MTPETTPNPQLSQLTTFMKAEPKALGTVQIMIGVFILLFGIIFLSMLFFTTAVFSGITLWGSLLFITSGALSVAAANNTNSCVVKAALGMNVVSAVTAGLALILFAVDMILGSIFSSDCYRYNSDNECTTVHLGTGICAVLFVFSLLELIISIRTSCFACKATKYTETTVMNLQPMYSQPMHSTALYKPQARQQSSVVTDNKIIIIQ